MTVPKWLWWSIAKEYTLADNFFMGAFGGSFLNHIWLACACVPKYPDADRSPAKGQISVVESDGVTLKLAPGSPKSALDGVPKFVKDGNLTPDFYAVNTMQPPYQPSANKPTQDGDPALANPENPSTLPPQNAQTIGDLLSGKKRQLGMVWRRAKWQAALSWKNARPVPNFPSIIISRSIISRQWRPRGTSERAKHLKDGGLDGAEFIKAI